MADEVHLLGITLDGFYSYWVYAMVGLVLGVGIDHINRRVKDRVQSTWVSLSLQVAILCSVPALLNTVGLASFVLSWQTSLAGLFFAAFFLGTQASILSMIAPPGETVK